MAKTNNINDTGSVTLVIVLVLAVAIGLFYYLAQIGRNGDALVTETPTQGAEYVQMISAKSISTNEINITGCKPSPDIANIKLGATLKITNNDPVPHHISFDPQNLFVVEAKSTLNKKMDLWKLPGVRHYNCDNNTKVGTIYATINK